MTETAGLIEAYRATASIAAARSAGGAYGLIASIGRANASASPNDTITTPSILAFIVPSPPL